MFPFQFVLNKKNKKNKKINKYIHVFQVLLRAIINGHQKRFTNKMDIYMCIVCVVKLLSKNNYIYIDEIRTKWRKAVLVW
jgi:cyanate permease